MSETRFHVNPETGRTGVCKAVIKCRFGLSAEDHYATRAEAAAAYEKTMDGATVALTSIHKEMAHKREIKAAMDELHHWENSPARHQYGFPEDEMVRGNIEDKIREVKRQIFGLLKRNDKLTDKDGNLWNVEMTSTQVTADLRHGTSSEKRVVTVRMENPPSGYAGETYRDIENLGVSWNDTELRPVVKHVHESENAAEKYLVTAAGTRVWSEIPKTPVKFENVVTGFIQYNKKNPGQTPQTAEEVGTKSVIVPNVKRLTEKRMIQIGEVLWREAGRNTDAWAKASEEERLRFSQSRVHRLGNATVQQEDKYGTVGWTYDNGMRQGDIGDVLMMDLED